MTQPPRQPDEREPAASAPAERAAPQDLLDTIARGLAAASDEEFVPDEPARVQERSLERLLEISHAMSRIHDRERLFDSVSAWLRELFDAENSFVILLDAKGRPKLQSAYLREPGSDGFPISETILERAKEARCPIAIDDTSEVPDLSGRISIERNHIRSVLCAPLVIGEDVIGVLQFDHRSSSTRFPERDRRLLQLFADQAATAFQNLQLIEEIRESGERLKRAHEQVVQAERLSALGTMASGVAHNFNNTLFLALGQCDVLLSRDDLERDVRGPVESIRQCAMDAATTVRRISDFARRGAGGDLRGLCDPGSVARGLIPMFDAKLREVRETRGLQVRVEQRMEPTPQVAARAADLREVLINLMFNAADAMQRDGVVELTSGCDDERVFLRVRDQGTGMEPEVASRVFEPFFSTKALRGAGLGLSTSWSIVRRIGGDLEVESEPGRGSTFTLWLPSATEPDGEVDAASLERAAEGLRVLVIDDDPQVLRTMGNLLQTLGHEATEAGGPREGLAAFEAGRFDVVMTDLLMPEVSGSEVARLVHGIDPSVPIFVVTGWGPDAACRARSGAGVSEVLEKPLSLDDLRKALSRAIPSHG